MELNLLLPLLLAVLLVQATTIFMAKLLGRNVRVWFWISLLLPVISWIIIACLPVQKKQLLPVENEDLFNHLFEEKEKK